MNSLELRNLLLRKLYIEDPDGLDGTILTGLKEDVAAGVNRAFQVIWTAPWDFFRRDEFTFNTVAATREYLLEEGIQEVLGVVKVNSATPHLRPISNRSDFDSYGTRFLGQLTDTVTAGSPKAYFLQRFGTGDADAVQVKMFLVPTPDDVYTITYEASTEAPNFTVAEIDAAGDLSIPANYVESILVPLSRFFCSSSHFFLADRRAAEISQMNADFEMAMRQLGYTDPQIKQFRGKEDTEDGKRDNG